MKKILYIVIVLCFIGGLHTRAQVPSKAAKLQSIYIYNFMLKIQWPEHKRTGDFIIGVMGNTPLYAELLDMASKRKIYTRDITVKQIYADSDVQSCHLIFIPSGEDALKNLESTKKKLDNYSGVLIVTEQQDMAKQGSILNFVLIENKLRFELNEAEASFSGFKTSAINKYAIIVN